MCNALVFVIAAIEGVAFVSGQTEGVREAGLSEVVTSWNNRQARVQTATFKWNEEKIQGRGAFPSLDGSAPQPTTDIVMTNALTLTFDEHRMIYTYDGWEWAGSDRKLHKQHYTSTYDGVEPKMYWSVGATHPKGIIRATQYNDDVSNLYVKPLLLAYRPFSSMAGAARLDTTNFVLSTTPAVVAGHNCFVLQERPHTRTQGWCRFLYVDPEKDYSVMRYEETVNQKKVITLDITYERDPDDGWIPARWKSVWLKGDGTFLESAEATVTSFEINRPQDDHVYAVTFRDGTWVDDQARKQQYIVREGRKRIITREELIRGAKYGDLLGTESGMAGLGPAQRWTASGVRIVTVMIIVGLACILLGAWRLKRSTAR